MYCNTQVGTTASSLSPSAAGCLSALSFFVTNSTPDRSGGANWAHKFVIKNNLGGKENILYDLNKK